MRKKTLARPDDGMYPKGIPHQLRISIKWAARACSLGDERFSVHSMRSVGSTALSPNGYEFDMISRFGGSLSDCVRQYIQFGDCSIRLLSGGLRKDPGMIHQMRPIVVSSKNVKFSAAWGEIEGENPVGQTSKILRKICLDADGYPAFRREAIRIPSNSEKIPVAQSRKLGEKRDAYPLCKSSDASSRWESYGAIAQPAQSLKTLRSGPSDDLETFVETRYSTSPPI